MKNRQLRNRSQREILPPIQFAASPALEGLLSEQLSPAAQAFLEELHLRFEARWRDLLEGRLVPEGEVGDIGAWMRSGGWQLAPPPPRWQAGRRELHCPAGEAFGSPNEEADTIVTDLEAPRAWADLLAAHRALQRSAKAPSERFSGIALRPRAWHLTEPRFRVRGEPMAASLFDLGLYLFHAAEALLETGRGPHLHLAKLEGPRDARLWNDVLVFAERVLGLPVGTVRVTLLIDTVAGAREAEEMLYELRDHALALALDPAAYAQNFSQRGMALSASPSEGLNAFARELGRRRGAQVLAAVAPGGLAPLGLDGSWFRKPSIFSEVPDEVVMNEIWCAEQDTYPLQAGYVDASASTFMFAGDTQVLL